MKFKELCLLLVLIITPVSEIHAQSVIVDYWNKGGVANWPNALTKFEIKKATYISYIDTYHWNNGKGSTGNNFGPYIKLNEVNSNKQYGPWLAQLKSGMNNAPNVHWIVKPNITLPPGIYRISDSDPATWSHNNASNHMGFSKVESGSTGGLLSSVQSSQSSDIQGKWQSNWGEIILQQSGNNITGTYTTSNGKIYGVLDGNTLTGYWTQDSASQSCSTAKYGTRYWGRIKFTFDQFKTFSGNWGYCDDPPETGGWTGKR